MNTSQTPREKTCTPCDVSGPVGACRAVAQRDVLRDADTVHPAADERRPPWMA